MTEKPESDTHSTKNKSASADPAAKDTAKDGGKTSGMQDKINEQAQQTAAFWNDRQHRELLFYLSVAIFFLELVVGVVAFLYGVIHATPGADGGPPRFQFPWLAYILAAVVTPAALLLLVHLAGVGLFRSLRGQDQDEAWRQDLPQRLRKVYAIIQGAPTVVLLVGIMLLGAALFYIDGAMTALFRLGATAEEYLPWIIGGVVAAWCVGYVARTWLNYRTKRMEAEFEFRREVLERTGVIIVDRGSMQLPPAGADLDPARALGSGQGGQTGQGAIPINGGPLWGGADSDADAPQGPVLDVTPQGGTSAPKNDVTPGTSAPKNDVTPGTSAPEQVVTPQGGTSAPKNDVTPGTSAPENVVTPEGGTSAPEQVVTPASPDPNNDGTKPQ